MLEQDRVIEACYQRLAGDSTYLSLIGGRVEREPNSDNTYPRVELGLQAAVPVTFSNGDRSHQNVVIRVNTFVATRGGQGWGLLRQITDRADTLLQGYSAVVSGAYVVRLRYDGAIDSVDSEGDTYYLQRTVLYRTEVSAA